MTQKSWHKKINYHTTDIVILGRLFISYYEHNSAFSKDLLSIYIN